MTLKKRFFLSTLFLGIFTFGHFSPIQSCQAQAPSPERNLSIWPSPETGYTRFVIILPVLKNETRTRLEIIPQKKMKVDCNLTSIHGVMETKTIQGWGYPYYYLSHISAPVSTFMACPHNTLREKPVAVSIDSPFLVYNSKLPVVIYAPKEITISYRVWNAKAIKKAKKDITGK